MQLTDSCRCTLFEHLAAYVWDEVSLHHQQNIHCPEIAITNKIIALIRKSGDNENIGLWANNAIKEKVHGSDIDIFIEGETNQFHWYALQAKIMTQDKRYEGIHRKRQWEKLSLLQSISGCIPFFLFYNGQQENNFTSNDPAEKQYGCSIVPVKEISTLAAKYAKLKYSDLHPKIARPWRELVCENIHNGNGRTYSVNQIRDAVSLYDDLLHPSIIDRDDYLSRELYNPQQMKSFNEAVNRQPEFILVIRNPEPIAS